MTSTTTTGTTSTTSTSTTSTGAAGAGASGRTTRTVRRTRVARGAAAFAASTAAVAVGALVGPVQPAAASCEFPTYQYVVTGETVSLWSAPEQRVKATLWAGDVVNSSLRPDAGGGWLVGNAYTPSRQHVGDGWVLRHWTSYTGVSWCP